MKKATFDPSVNIDLYFRENRNGSKEFRFFDVAGDPVNIVDTFEFRSDFDVTVEIETNIIRLVVDSADVDDTRASYFWELVNITTGKTWFCGTAYFTEGLSKEISDSLDITFSPEGEPIEVTLSESGGDGVDHFKGAWDASGGTFPGDADTLAGDEWYFSVGGTVNGLVWPTGTIAKALIDNPGQTPANWRLI